MQSDNCKLFVGGISWDTNEERLKQYFSLFGEVVEAVIMKDRNTGRARGFGFIVFADSTVADRVILEKHSIDGRMVEAKRAVPREDKNVIVRNIDNIHGSSPCRSLNRKIFVGGLASTVTETEFKKYFDQFGSINDVVVMYDHNTMRPRGFGFITYDSDEAVERVLLKTFHELNGKLVEVKRAVPKELPPSLSRGPIGGQSHGLSRVGSFLDGYIQGCSPGLVGGYGLGREDRFMRVFSPTGHGYEMGINFEPRLRPGYSSSPNSISNFSFGGGLSPSNIGEYKNGDPGDASFFSFGARDQWGSGGLKFATNSPSPKAYIGLRNESNGSSAFMNSAVNWSSSPISAEDRNTNISKNATRNLEFGFGSDINDLDNASSGKNGHINALPSSLYGAMNREFEGSLDSFCKGGTYYNESSWISSNSEKVGSVSFGHGLQNAGTDGYVFY